jgi:hypothetical protein
MQLRSGKVYDPTYPMREKMFMSFDNPEFRAIWDQGVEVFKQHWQGDDRNRKFALHMHRMYIIGRVREALTPT